MSARVKIGASTFEVEDTAQATRDGRPVYAWSCLVQGKTWNGEDLYGPAAGPEPSEEDMVRTLLHFVGAAFESRAYRLSTGREGENESLFPAEMLDALACEADAIQCFLIQE